MEDQAVHVIGEVGQSEFGFSPLDADGADEQAIAIFLMGEDVLDMGMNG